MDKEAIFDAWAPEGALWSPWCKPVLFAHLPRALPKRDPVPDPDLSWAPPAAERIAIVVERPGLVSVALGLALAELGYRPVPLFNACPPPVPDPLFEPFAKSAELALVDVDSILAALVIGVDRLRALNLPADAPPAFLLDSERGHSRMPVRSGLFDNRSVVFSTDFPSARFLRDHGISSAVVANGTGRPLAFDLEHALRAWSTEGIALFLKSAGKPGPPEPLALAAPTWWRALVVWFTSRLRFRRNPDGDFGRFIPEAASG
jgi:hypothetical protein